MVGAGSTWLSHRSCFEDNANRESSMWIAATLRIVCETFLERCKSRVSEREGSIVLGEWAMDGSERQAGRSL